MYVCRYHYSIPYTISLILHVTHTVLLWRVGPAVTRSTLFLVSLPVYWGGQSTAAVWTFLGPLDSYPFQSSVHFLIFITVAVAPLNVTHKCGLLYTEHPPTPRSSMLKPMLKAAVMTSRFMDNLTDFGLFRTVLDEVRSPSTACRCMPALNCLLKDVGCALRRTAHSD